MRTASRRSVLKGAAVVGAASLFSSQRAFSANNPTQIGVVGKVKIPWFDNVEKGVAKAGQDLGVRRLYHQPDDRRSSGASPRHRGL